MQRELAAGYRLMPLFNWDKTHEQAIPLNDSG